MEPRRAHRYNSPMRQISRTALAALLIFIFAIVTTGCGTQQETPAQRAQRVESMLATAGFHVLPADTPARQAQLQSLTPLKMRFYPHNGKMHYWYADPYYCNCIYSGNEKAYDAYQRIKLQQQMANQQNLSTQANEEAASQEYMNAMAWPANQVFYGGD
jgi:hypothetical protein